MPLVNLKSAMSGRPQGPYTVKKRRPVQGMPKRCAYDVRHHLVRLLGRGVERDRMVRCCRARGTGMLGVGAVDRARGGVHQVAGAVVARALEDVQEAGHVRVDVGVRVLERVAHAGLGGEVHDGVELPAREERSPSRRGRARSARTNVKRRAASAARSSRASFSATS